MHWLDWIVVIVPLGAVVWIGFKIQFYSKNVAGFLAGGRLAGRYLLSVADGTAVLGLISVVATFEMQYRSGWALNFWGQFAALIGLAMTLTGFVSYRYRETRVLTMAQFFEIRYSRGFRILAGSMAFLSGVMNYALFPAVSARFVIYYCGLPDTVSCFGIPVSLFGLLMAGFLGIALCVVLTGGQLTSMVTDCVQGLFGYFAYAVLVAAVFAIFSMRNISGAVLARPAGESFFNPFNIDRLGEFNILFILIGMFAMVYNRNAWLGTQGFYCAASSPHEQKMAGVLGSWRSGFQGLMMMLLVMGAYTYLNAPEFASGAEAVRTELAQRITADNQGSEAIAATIRTQMLVPVALRQLLPVGVTGLFCALMLCLMVSTDTTYLHSWGSILVQDIIQPLRKRPFQTHQQLLALRLAIAGIAVFAWFFSFFFGQMDFILMFFALTGSIYLGGAGAVIIGGLYWKRGTTAGAYAAMLVGGGFGVGGFLVQRHWADIVTWSREVSPGMLEAFRQGLLSLNRALPITYWDLSPENFARHFPISGQELYLIGMLLAIAAYVAFSLVTCRREFNLEKMLHRGKYNLEHFVADNPESEALEQEEKSSKRKVFHWQMLLGITPEYTRGDRILAWSVLLWTLWGMAIFGFQLVCNLFFGRWSEETWFQWWCYYNLPLSILYGVVTSIWFSIGGIRDLRRLFRALKRQASETNAAADRDNGYVRREPQPRQAEVPDGQVSDIP